MDIEAEVRKIVGGRDLIGDKVIKLCQLFPKTPDNPDEPKPDYPNGYTHTEKEMAIILKNLNKLRVRKPDEGTTAVDYPKGYTDAEAKCQQGVERGIEIITEDFVEMIGNYYMTDDNRKSAYELWDGIKKRVLRKEEGI